MNQKNNKYTLHKLEKWKLQKIGDSSNNDRAGAPEMFYKKVFYESFVKITGKYLYQILFLNKVLDVL